MRVGVPVHADPVFAMGLNILGSFTGTNINRENIGKASDALTAMWNEKFQEDQVGFSAN